MEKRGEEGKLRRMGKEVKEVVKMEKGKGGEGINEM